AFCSKFCTVLGAISGKSWKVKLPPFSSSTVASLPFTAPPDAAAPALPLHAAARVLSPPARAGSELRMNDRRLSLIPSSNASAKLIGRRWTKDEGRMTKDDGGLPFVFRRRTPAPG